MGPGIDIIDICGHGSQDRRGTKEGGRRTHPDTGFQTRFEPNRIIPPLGRPAKTVHASPLLTDNR